MLKLTKIAFLASALIAGATFVNTASAALTEHHIGFSSPSHGLLAREGGEGARGEGGKQGGHPAIEGVEQLAREGGEGARGEGGKQGGHPAIEGVEQVARHGADDRQPDDRGGRRGGRG